MSGPLRIAIVSETFVPQTNGIVTRLCQALRYLPERGDKVLLLVPDPGGDGGSAEHEGVRIHGVSAFPLPAYPDLPVALPRPAVNRELDRFWPDVVHAVNPALLGLNAIYHSKRHRVPLICSFHTHLPRYLQHYGLGALEPVAWQMLRRVHAEADRNLCISRPMEEELRRHGFPRLRLGWRGGVDATRFDPRRGDAEMRRRLLGANSEGALLLYVGRLGAEKGIERLRGLLDALPQARLALVGDGPHRPVLEQVFEGSATTFVGRLMGDELAQAYASADVFTFPSDTETLGLVVLEAMASGLPVVAADAGGVPDLVRSGEDGILLPPDATARWVEAVGGLLEDRLRRVELGSRARLAVERAWTWEAATADLRAHYVDLVGERAVAA